MNHQEHETSCREIADDEIDLVDLFLIVWKRKWMIVVFTLVLTISAAGISFFLPKVYEISAIIEPGRDADGKVIEKPQAIRENILGGAYDQVLLETLGEVADSLPQYKVFVPKDTDLVKITIESSNPKRDIIILNKLLTEVSSSIQERLELKINEIKFLIKETVIEGQAIADQIKLIEKQIVQTEHKIVELESGRKQALASPKNDAMAVLLYSNEMQNKQIYSNELQYQLTDLESRKKQNVIDIENINLKLSNIKGTNINKHPSIPPKPIKPKKTLIVVLAFVLGLMGGILLAFMAEFMVKVRQQQKK